MKFNAYYVQLLTMQKPELYTTSPFIQETSSLKLPNQNSNAVALMVSDNIFKLEFPPTEEVIKRKQKWLKW